MDKTSEGMLSKGRAWQHIVRHSNGGLLALSSCEYLEGAVDRGLVLGVCWFSTAPFTQAGSNL